MPEPITFEAWYELNKNREWNTRHEMFKSIFEAGKNAGRTEIVVKKFRNNSNL